MSAISSMAERVATIRCSKIASTLFNASRVPFIFVPATTNGPTATACRMAPTTRWSGLNKLRSLFWRDSLSLGQKSCARTPAGAYPEHARFRLGPVLFVTPQPARRTTITE
jgi:hypothetical protein